MGLKKLDITGEQKALLLTLIDEFLPETEVWIYGSRIDGTAKPYSDLDMVVFTSPEQRVEVMELREAFEESNLPFRVDLFVWSEIPEQFRKNIKTNHVVLDQKQQK